MSEDPYYLIPRSHLPEAIRKAVEVSELLSHQRDLNVSDAVRQVGISRSAYYKYKDVVRPFYKAVHGNIVTIVLTLRHIPGILSDVLNMLAAERANILTINQSLPLRGAANVTISMETDTMVKELEQVLDLLRDVQGVEQVHLVGES